MSGFTYNGVHCSTYKCEYVPDGSARWFEDAAFKVYDSDVTWKHGGYYYGNRVNIRQFKLKCYFEEITVAEREKIRRWLGRNTSGRLIFDDRPFIYYNVRPTNVVSGEIYNDTGKYSGTFTVTFSAHDPFGYLTRKSNAGTESDNAEDYCGLISTSNMPDSPTTSSTSFNVYNPGTEACGLSIQVAGTAGKPFRFFNKANGTQCAISSLPSNGLILDINGDTGMVLVKSSVSAKTGNNGYAYHDYGYVRLEPWEQYVSVPCTFAVDGQNNNNRIITLTNMPASEKMLGALIDVSATRKAHVIAVNTSNNKLTCTISGSGAMPTGGSGTVDRILLMNQIIIEEKNTNGAWVTPTSLTLTTLNIDYSPRAL